MENPGRRKSLRNAVHEVLAGDDVPRGQFYKYAMVWMSRVCNSRCKYCYQDGDSGASSSWSYEKADRVTSLFLNAGYHVQPLINEWLPEFWDFMKLMKKCEWKEITTNGLIILKRYGEFFPLLRENGVTDIRHSLFPAGIHEEMTGRPRATAMRAIELSKEHGFRVVVNYVVTKETLPRIIEVCDELAAMGVDEIQFMNLMYLGRAKEIRRQLLTLHDLKDFWALWKQVTTDERYAGIEFDFQANFGPSPHGDHVSLPAARKNKYCIAGANEHGHFLYVTPENDIYPCFLLSDDPRFKIGEIVEERGDYKLVLDQTLGWEQGIPRFTRSQCASLQLLSREVFPSRSSGEARGEECPD